MVNARSLFNFGSFPCFLLLICFLLKTVDLRAQQSQIDSLKNQLNQHQYKDSIRVNLLNDLALYLHEKKSEEAVTFIQESESISKTIHYKKGLAKSLYLKGRSMAFQSNYMQGLAHYHEALDIYRLLGSKEGLADCYRYIGRFFYKSGDQKKAIESFTKSVKIYEELNNSELVFTLLMNIGWSYIILGDYDIALTFYNKGLEINETANNDNLLGFCLLDIGIIYTHKGNYPKALEYFNQSLTVAKKNSDETMIGNILGNMAPVYDELQDYDKAIAYYKESLEIFKDVNQEAVASNLSNIGVAYKNKKDYQQALLFMQDGLKVYRKINNKTGQSFTLNNIGDVYFEKKEFSDAIQYYEESKKINLEVESQLGLCHSYLGIAKVYANEKKYDEALSYALKSQQISIKNELITYQRDVLGLLVDIYKNKNLYTKALSSHEMFKKLNDSLFNKENIEKIAQLEYEFKYKQALDSASIRELKLNKTILSTSQDLAKTKQNYLWAVIGILTTSILSGSFVFYQKYKTVKIKNQNIVTEQKLLRSQMTPHFIFNSLSVLQGMILNKEEKKSVTYLSKFSKLLRIVLENSRDKIVPLIQELDAIDNYMTLQNLDADPPYDYSLMVDENIDINQFLIPPMLIQPFIENAIEHAFTADQEHREIAIHIRFEHKKLSCTITDNGVGINAINNKPNTKKKSLATTITGERLQLLAKDFHMPGDLKIEDRKKDNEQGTKVTLVIPYKLNSVTY